MGESTTPRAPLRFDRRVQLELCGVTITSDARLPACRELDDALGLTETAEGCHGCCTSQQRFTRARSLDNTSRGTAGSLILMRQCSP